METFLHELYARNIFELETSIAKETILLNEDWKAKVSSYVSHIRAVVNKTEIEEPLRENILKSSRNCNSK